MEGFVVWTMLGTQYFTYLKFRIFSSFNKDMKAVKEKVNRAWHHLSQRFLHLLSKSTKKGIYIISLDILQAVVLNIDHVSPFMPKTGNLENNLFCNKMFQIFCKSNQNTSLRHLKVLGSFQLSIACFLVTLQTKTVLAKDKYFFLPSSICLKNESIYIYIYKLCKKLCPIPSRATARGKFSGTQSYSLQFLSLVLFLFLDKLL